MKGMSTHSESILLSRHAATAQHYTGAFKPVLKGAKEQPSLTQVADIANAEAWALCNERGLQMSFLAGQKKQQETPPSSAKAKNMEVWAGGLAGTGRWRIWRHSGLGAALETCLLGCQRASEQERGRRDGWKWG